MLFKSHLLSVVLAAVASNVSTLCVYAQQDDEQDLVMMQKMCECASKHNLCNEKCPSISEKLFQLNDDEECKVYASEAFGCGTAFSSKKKYEKLCPTIGVPCTTEQQMCACAAKHDLCGETCDSLSGVDGDPECTSYAAGGCGGSLFSSNKSYHKTCKKKKIKMPCNTNSQKMCACANKHKLCSKTCGALFGVEDPDCKGYLVNSLCGGESFPDDVRYQDHCQTEGINMKCKKGACKDNKKWKITIDDGYGNEAEKKCKWVSEDPEARCNDTIGSKGKGSNEMCKESCNTCAFVKGTLVQ